MSDDRVGVLRTRADGLRSGIDAALDLVLDTSGEAPDEEAARRLRADAFALVAAFHEGADLLARGALLLEASRLQDAAP